MSNKKFSTLHELLRYISTYEGLFDEPSFMGSQQGIMQQFLQFNVPAENRKENEVMIIYYEPDYTMTPVTFVAKSQWFDKKTRLAIDEPPVWFKERKKKILEMQN